VTADATEPRTPTRPAIQRRARRLASPGRRISQAPGEVDRGGRAAAQDAAEARSGVLRRAIRDPTRFLRPPGCTHITPRRRRRGRPLPGAGARAGPRPHLMSCGLPTSGSARPTSPCWHERRRVGRQPQAHETVVHDLNADPALPSPTARSTPPSAASRSTTSRARESSGRGPVVVPAALRVHVLQPLLPDEAIRGGWPPTSRAAPPCREYFRRAGGWTRHTSSGARPPLGRPPRRRLGAPD